MNYLKSLISIYPLIPILCVLVHGWKMILCCHQLLSFWFKMEYDNQKSAFTVC